jgi:hypothetical protein
MTAKIESPNFGGPLCELLHQSLLPVTVLPILGPGYRSPCPATVPPYKECALIDNQCAPFRALKSL